MERTKLHLINYTENLVDNNILFLLYCKPYLVNHGRCDRGGALKSKGRVINQVLVCYNYREFFLISYISVPSYKDTYLRSIAS